MLPLEKCLELRNAGFEQCIPYGDNQPKIVYQDENFGGICAVGENEYLGYDLQVARIPTGDELLSECVKLLPDEWQIERTTNSNGLSCCIVWDEAFTDTIISDPQPNNSDLADLWLWLNERKKRNDQPNS